MITTDHYMRYAEKKRKKYLILCSLFFSVFIAILIVRIIKFSFLEYGYHILNIALLISVFIAILAFFSTIRLITNIEWYRFLGLREITNLIELEEKQGLKNYNGKHEHRDKLKKKRYR